MKVREARLEDHAAIAAVLRHNGLSCPDDDAWAHRWRGHPDREELSDVSMGWVLEDSAGDVVGTFGNLPLMYEHRGRRLRAAAASAWAVDPQHRRGSLLLLAKFFQQKNVDLLLDTTADAPAAKAFEAFKARRVPHPEYDQLLFWPTRYRAFTEAFLRRRQSPLRFVSGAAGLALRSFDAILGRNRWRHLPSEDRQTGHVVIDLDGFDERFDDFWDALRERFPERLLAVRDRPTLEWHFGPALGLGATPQIPQVDRARMFGLDHSGQLVGYIVLVRHDRPEIGLRRWLVADLQVLEESRFSIRMLLAVALRRAVQDGIDVVEVIGFGANKRRALLGLAPRQRQLASWPFFYKLNDPEQLAELDQSMAWDPCPFDGDASL